MSRLAKLVEDSWNGLPALMSRGYKDSSSVEKNVLILDEHSDGSVMPFFLRDENIFDSIKQKLFSGGVIAVMEKNILNQFNNSFFNKVSMNVDECPVNVCNFDTTQKRICICLTFH